ncbi:hypothetical protein D3C77_620510 [compost metagenome]
MVYSPVPSVVEPGALPEMLRASSCRVPPRSIGRSMAKLLALGWLRRALLPAVSASSAWVGLSVPCTPGEVRPASWLAS